MIDGSGRLVGVGSLWVNDAEPGSKDSPGNMFVPIDLLEPILDDLINKGFADVEPRPWLGMYTSEAMRRLFVSGVIPRARPISPVSKPAIWSPGSPISR